MSSSIAVRALPGSASKLFLFVQQSLTAFDFGFNFVGRDVIDLHGTCADFAPGSTGQGLADYNLEYLGANPVAINTLAARQGWCGRS